jgi:hypothetical protein
MTEHCFPQERVPASYSRPVAEAETFCFRTAPMQYVITAAFLLAVVAGSFAAVILGGYGIARLIAFAL